MNHIENEEVVLGAGDAGCSRSEITNRDDKAGPTDGISTTQEASSEGEDVVSGHENYDTDAGEPEKSVPQQEEERPQPTANGENNVRNVMRGSTQVQINNGVSLVNNLGGVVVIDNNQIGMNLTEGNSAPQQVQPSQPISDGANTAGNEIPPQRQQLQNNIQINDGEGSININGSVVRNSSWIVGDDAPQQVRPPQPIPEEANNAVNVIPPPQPFHNQVQINNGASLVNSIGGVVNVNITRRNN